MIYYFHQIHKSNTVKNKFITQIYYIMLYRKKYMNSENELINFRINVFFLNKSKPLD